MTQVMNLGKGFFGTFSSATFLACSNKVSNVLSN